MGERETSHCRDFHPTSYQQLVRLHPRRQHRKESILSLLSWRPLRLCARLLVFDSFLGYEFRFEVNMALKLAMTCGRYDRAQALIDGTVKPEGIDLEVHINEDPGRHTK